MFFAHSPRVKVDVFSNTWCVSLLQLVSNGLVFLAVNVSGIFIHQLTERAQRRAFLDTRNCIAARLEMEEENEKLVSYHSRTSPSSVRNFFTPRVCLKFLLQI